MVSITEIQGSCASLISWSRWYFLTFLIISAALDLPFILKLGHVDDDEIPFSESILSKLCW